MEQATEVTVDVSELEPPEPLYRVLGALEELKPGQFVRMLHRMEPVPLYRILDDDGFDHLTQLGDDVAFEILIWRRGDAVAERGVEDRRREGAPP